MAAMRHASRFGGTLAATWCVPTENLQVDFSRRTVRSRRVSRDRIEEAHTAGGALHVGGALEQVLQEVAQDIVFSCS